MANRLSTVLACAFIAGAAFGQSEDGITYKGLRLGATPSELVSKLPDYSCQELPSGAMCTYDSYSCAGSLGGTARADVQAYTARLNACDERNSFGGALVETAKALFKDDHLYQVHFTFHWSQAAVLLDAARVRYGQPKTASDEPLQLRSGAKVRNLHAEWIVGNTALSAAMRSGQVDKGSATLTTTEHLRATIEERRAAQRKGAADF